MILIKQVTLQKILNMTIQVVSQKGKKKQLTTLEFITLFPEIPSFNSFAKEAVVDTSETWKIILSHKEIKTKKFKHCL